MYNFSIEVVSEKKIKRVMLLRVRNVIASLIA